MARIKTRRKLESTEGFFSIHGTQAPVRHGRICYSPTTGVKLRTYDRFKPDSDRHSAGEAQYDSIHGIVEDGSHVRLYNVRGFEVTRLPGIAHSKYNAEYLLYGYCHLGLSERRVSALNGRFRYLRRWLDFPSYKSEFEPLAEGSASKYRHSLVSQGGASIKVFQNDGFSITMRLQHYVPWGRVNNVEKAISETAQVIFNYSFPVDVPSATQDLLKLERFLGLVTQRDMPITGMDVKLKKPEFDDTLERGRLDPREEYHRLFHFRYPRMPKEKLISSSPFLFSYGQVKERFPTVYANWLRLYPELSPALEQFFEQRYNADGYEVVKHPFYSFVFEAIHKRVCPDSKHLSLRSRYQAVLREFLNVNQYFTEDRIMVYNKRLVDARNLIAHEGLLNATSPINYDNVIQYNELNQLLITYMTLKACGFDQNELQRSLTSDQMFTFFQSANAKM